MVAGVAVVVIETVFCNFGVKPGDDDLPDLTETTPTTTTTTTTTTTLKPDPVDPAPVVFPSSRAFPLSDWSKYQMRSFDTKAEAVAWLSSDSACEPLAHWSGYWFLRCSL